MTTLRKALFGAMLATAMAAGSGASAAIINGSDFTAGQNSQVIGGLTWTSNPGDFSQKTVGGFTGVGITGGRTNDEIDIGETLTATTAVAAAIRSITLGVLFNGPEFGDVLERVQITATVGNNVVFTLTTTLNDTEATLQGAPAGAFVENLSPASPGNGAVWRINFDPALSPVTAISFTALEGQCGAGTCNNPSDFTLVQVVTVPEPATLALLGAGLLGLGLARRARRKAA